MGGSNGRVAVVTGAGSGIGRATALRLAFDGARVACFDLDEAGNDETAARIAGTGGEVVARRVDVTDEGSVAKATEDVVAAFGGIDVLANVAGVGCFRRTEEAPLDEWQRIIAVNLTGVFLAVREALPHLLVGGGAVVNVASVAGVKGHAYAAAYSASKGGVVSLTKSLAVEFAKQKVRVNAVCPSGVMTPLLANFTMPDGADETLFARILAPNEGFCEPEEVASAIAYLASDDAVNITGAVLSIDGGVSA